MLPLWADIGLCCLPLLIWVLPWTRAAGREPDNGVTHDQRDGDVPTETDDGDLLATA